MLLNNHLMFGESKFKTKQNKNSYWFGAVYPSVWTYGFLLLLYVFVIDVLFQNAN